MSTLETNAYYSALSDVLAETIDNLSMKQMNVVKLGLSQHPLLSKVFFGAGISLSSSTAKAATLITSVAVPTTTKAATTRTIKPKTLPADSDRCVALTWNWDKNEKGKPSRCTHKADGHVKDRGNLCKTHRPRISDDADGEVCKDCSAIAQTEVKHIYKCDHLGLVDKPSCLWSNAQCITDLNNKWEKDRTSKSGSDTESSTTSTTAGAPKTTKTKAPRKESANGYIEFGKAMRPTVTAQLKSEGMEKGLIPKTVMSRLSAMWKSLPASEQATWKAKAASNKGLDTSAVEAPKAAKAAIIKVETISNTDEDVEDEDVDAGQEDAEEDGVDEVVDEVVDEADEDVPDVEADSSRVEFTHEGKTYYKDEDGFLYATETDDEQLFVVSAKGVVKPLA